MDIGYEGVMSAPLPQENPPITQVLELPPAAWSHCRSNRPHVTPAPGSNHHDKAERWLGQPSIIDKIAVQHV